MKFKTEIFLLLLAMVLYIVSAFCYFYQASWQEMPPYVYPYRDYAIPLAVIASVLLAIGAILYSKRR